MRSIWIAGWMLGTVLHLACAEDEAPPPDPVRWLPARSYCEQTAALFCPFYLRCGWMAAGNPAECERLFADSCEGRWEPLYGALAEAGLLALSAAGVQACAAHLAEVPCGEQATDLSGPCRWMWEGLQPADGACGMGAGGIESMVCAPGSRCTLDLTLCGTCTPTAGVGQGCELDRDCEVAAACVGDHCQPRVLPGGACSSAAPCVTEANCEGDVCVLRHVKAAVNGACQSALDCQYGLTCLGGTCQPTALQGHACSAAEPCTAGRCDGGTCVPLLGFGVECAAHGDCVSGACSGGTCATVPGACFAP